LRRIAPQNALTGKLSFARRASEYGGSSVHSIRIARMFGWAAITSNAFFSIPGVTAFTSTFSPFSTASKCGTSWQPTTMYRCCCVSTPHSSRIRSRIGSSVVPVAAHGEAVK